MSLSPNQRAVREAYLQGIARGKRLGRVRLALQTGLSQDKVRHALTHLRLTNQLTGDAVPPPPPTPISEQDLYQALRGKLTQKNNRDHLQDIAGLAEQYQVPVRRIRAVLERLREEGYNLHQDNGRVALTNQEAAAAPIVIDTAQEPERLHFGFVTDSHLGSKRERLDCLEDLYDLYADHGLRDVYHAGNMIEGFLPKINMREVHKYALDEQVEYMATVYPQRPGITTYFVTGDDHEGWFQRDVGMSVGRYMERAAVDQGRSDLRYIGYVEQDVFFRCAEGQFAMKVMHGGGGSAYALSYTPQKIVESFSGGEKPAVLLLGHYHKMEMMPNLRGVRVYQGGCTVDQSVWARKKRLQYHLGGWRIHLRQGINGACTGAISEDRTYYNREFYQHHNWEAA